MGLGKYIKKAFLFHWNLLAFAGGMGFALLSGHPDVLAPLVLAAETAYLGFIGTHPQFQRYVDAQEHKAARARRMPRPSSGFAGLPPAQLRRFQALQGALPARAADRRSSCASPKAPHPLRSLDELQLSDLDRLLWIYLRTLYTQHMLERFFESTSGDEIQAEIKRLEDRIRRLEKEPESANRSRIRQSLQGQPRDLQVAARQPGKRPARITSCFRPRSKTWKRRSSRSPSWRSTAAMPRRSPARSSRSLRGLIRTEQTINDLGFATGVESFDLTVPNILSREASPADRRRARARRRHPPARRTRSVSFDVR